MNAKFSFDYFMVYIYIIVTDMEGNISNTAFRVSMFVYQVYVHMYGFLKKILCALFIYVLYVVCMFVY